MSEDDVDPESIRERVALDRARGGRWRPTPEGGYKRLTSLEVLAERGVLSASAVSGAQSYRLDYLASIEAASMRSTIYARLGAREDEDEVLDRAFSATVTLSRIHREVLDDPAVGRLVVDLCGRDIASEAIERRSVTLEVSRHLEAVDRWYFRNDSRGERDRETAHMRLIDRDGWWLLAKVFNPRMSREAFEHYYAESGMALAQEGHDRRAESAGSTAAYLRSRLDRADTERLAKERYAEFIQRFNVRGASWDLLGQPERLRWLALAEIDQERAA